MRVVVSVAIILFVADKLIILGILMAIAAIITWVFVPIGKFINYLLTDPELTRMRTRAISSTVLATVAVIAVVGVVPIPDRDRAQGVVEPVNMKELYAGGNEFVTSLPLIDPPPASTDRNGMALATPGTTILTGDNPDTQGDLQGLLDDRKRVNIAYGKALADGEIGQAHALQDQLAAINDQIQHDKDLLAAMTLTAPTGGVVVTPDLEYAQGAYLTHGEKIGLVADLSHLIVPHHRPAGDCRPDHPGSPPFG